MGGNERKIKQRLTDFQPGKREINDVDEHPFGVQRVVCSVEEEGRCPFLGLGGFHQNIAPVEVPGESRTYL